MFFPHQVFTEMWVYIHSENFSVKPHRWVERAALAGFYFENAQRKCDFRDCELDVWRQQSCEGPQSTLSWAEVISEDHPGGFSLRGGRFFSHSGTNEVIVLWSRGWSHRLRSLNEVSWSWGSTMKVLHSFMFFMATCALTVSLQRLRSGNVLINKPF